LPEYEKRKPLNFIVIKPKPNYKNPIVVTLLHRRHFLNKSADALVKAKADRRMRLAFAPLPKISETMYHSARMDNILV
jgi:hypothetical protein